MKAPYTICLALLVLPGCYTPRQAENGQLVPKSVATGNPESDALVRVVRDGFTFADRGTKLLLRQEPFVWECSRQNDNLLPQYTCVERC